MRLEKMSVVKEMEAGSKTRMVKRRGRGIRRSIRARAPFFAPGFGDQFVGGAASISRHYWRLPKRKEFRIWALRPIPIGIDFFNIVSKKNELAGYRKS
jgi:hypothetical protein